METPRDEYFAVALGSRDACAGAQLRSELPGLEAADAALAVAVTSHFLKSFMSFFNFSPYSIILLGWMSPTWCWPA